MNSANLLIRIIEFRNWHDLRINAVHSSKSLLSIGINLPINTLSFKRLICIWTCTLLAVLNVLAQRMSHTVFLLIVSCLLASTEALQTSSWISKGVLFAVGKRCSECFSTISVCPAEIRQVWSSTSRGSEHASVLSGVCFSLDVNGHALAVFSQSAGNDYHDH